MVRNLEIGTAVVGSSAGVRVGRIPSVKLPTAEASSIAISGFLQRSGWFHPSLLLTSSTASRHLSERPSLRSE